MTLKQRLLKLAYPVIAAFSPKKASDNMENRLPKEPFYGLEMTLNTGRQLSFESLRGKYVLVTNTASFCGYTGQYEQLQQLHEKYGEKIAVLGFPCNDFGNQEPHNDDEIAGFCQVNYGVSFPLSKKVQVTGTEKDAVFDWLCNAEKNGWNNKTPDWNFCKYLIDPDGKLLAFFNSAVNPIGDDILKYLN